MNDSFPPVDSAALPAAEERRLRNSHPLYGRMNGEVIWMVHEELGRDSESCAAALDEELALRRRSLDILATLERHPEACCVLEVPDGPCGTCTGCDALPHLALDAGLPQWRQWLPPYAVGCRVRGRLMACVEARQAGHHPPAADARPPRRSLACPCLAPEN